MRGRRPQLIAGVMSGTSCDAVDVALLRVNQAWRWELLGFHHAPYRRSERQRLLAAASGEARVPEVAELHTWLGRRIGAAVLETCRAAGVAAERLDLVASHGQTIYHAGGRCTLQIGDPAGIAAVTGCPVVSDFRAADVAVGGQGAPLVPWADYRFFAHPRRYRVALNLGGIANLTLLPPGGPVAEVVAFDTGPANMLSDLCVMGASGGRKQYDAGGGLALAGRSDPAMLAHLLRHPFFRRRPPKSAGREEFGAGMVEDLARAFPRARLEDTLATLAELVAAGVARGLRWGGAGALEAEVIVSGGGIGNLAIRGALERAAPGCQWRTTDEFGVPSQAKEAMAFALLGVAHLRGEAANIPRVTGARQAVVLGSYTSLLGAGRH